MWKQAYLALLAVRLYLALLAVRLYLAMSPSYIHPDEHFQGPEIISGAMFHYPSYKTWEFVADNPIRSVFPLWVFYGPPMYTLRLLWEGVGRPDVPPMVAFWTLRLVMFLLSFVLVDGAILELIESPRQRQLSMVLIASSYVTGTYQTHTFSNSIETILVLWSLVIINKILRGTSKGLLAPAILGILLVLGVFTRITFAAFLLLPSVLLLLRLVKRPLALATLVGTIFAISALAIVVDTTYYRPETATSAVGILRRPVLAPLNMLLYNANHSNLAQHGLHPYYQHFAVNLPLLLGPAAIFVPYKFYKLFTKVTTGLFRRGRPDSPLPPCDPIGASKVISPRPPPRRSVFSFFVSAPRRFCALFTSSATALFRRSRPGSPVSSNDSMSASRDMTLHPPLQRLMAVFLSSILFLSAITGCLILSFLPHQEARFLLPAIPLILTSIGPIRSPRLRRSLRYSWIGFNLAMAVLMGLFHQAGIVPIQAWLGDQLGHGSAITLGTTAAAAAVAPERALVSDVLWWKTYSPPYWLMNGANEHVRTVDLMGMPPQHMIDHVRSLAATALSCSPEIVNDGKWTESGASPALLLVAPDAAEPESIFIESGLVGSESSEYRLRKEWTVRRHVSLDNLDFAQDGIWGTITGLVKRRGLSLWSIQRTVKCPSVELDIIPSDQGQVVAAPTRV